MFSHGYKEHMEKLMGVLGESSRKRQTFLMSATLNEVSIFEVKLKFVCISTVLCLW